MDLETATDESPLPVNEDHSSGIPKMGLGNGILFAGPRERGDVRPEK